MRGIVVLFFLISDGAPKQNQKPVRVISAKTARNYSITNGDVQKIEKSPLSDVIERFDENGRLLTVEEIVHKTKVVWKREHKYDDKGKVLEISITANGARFQRQRFEYEEGRLVLLTYFDEENEKALQTSYKYGKGSLLEEEVTVDAFGDAVDKTIYEYDGSGRVTAMTRIAARSKTPVARRAYKYDDAGRVIETTYFSNGKMVERAESVYMPGGDLSEIRRYDSKETLKEKLSYRYGSDGLLHEVFVYKIAGGKELLKEKTEYEYEYFK